MMISGESDCCYVNKVIRGTGMRVFLRCKGLAQRARRAGARGTPWGLAGGKRAAKPPQKISEPTAQRRRGKSPSRVALGRGALRWGESPAALGRANNTASLRVKDKVNEVNFVLDYQRGCVKWEATTANKADKQFDSPMTGQKGT